MFLAAFWPGSRFSSPSRDGTCLAGGGGPPPRPRSPGAGKTDDDVGVRWLVGIPLLDARSPSSALSHPFMGGRVPLLK